MKQLRHLIILYILAAAVESCSYIDPSDSETVGDRETEIAVKCDVDRQPQQWHFKVVDDNDATKDYYNEKGSINVFYPLAAILVHNIDTKHVDIVDSEEDKTTVARTVGAGRLYNGKTVCFMPDSLFSDFKEVNSSQVVQTMTLTPVSRIKTFGLQLNLKTTSGNITGCKSAIIDGMADGLNLVTLDPSSNDVALVVPVVLDSATKSGQGSVAVASARITTFGNAALSQNNTMFLTLIYSNGTEKNLVIDMTGDFDNDNEGKTIVKTIDVDNEATDADDGVVTVEERETENIHISI